MIMIVSTSPIVIPILIRNYADTCEYWKMTRQRKIDLREKSFVKL